MGRLSRAEVIARSGVIATGHPLASAAGLRVLMDGGNAVDAAVAAAGVLGVVQPMMSGLGGDTFALVWRAADGQPWALNSSGVAPYAATPEWFLSRGHRRMPLRGMLSVAVPGAVDAMATALARWGSGRFSLAQLLQPAAAYAETGFPVAPTVARWIAQAADEIARYPSTARIYLPRGRPPQPGEILVNPDLATSLRIVGEGGAEAFYRGPLARHLAAYCQAHGGLLTEREFAEHHCEVYPPLSTTYRGLTVYTTAPPSQGIIALEMLNILEGFAPGDLRWGTARAVHLMVEAKKLAFADRLAFLGDPRFVTNPLQTLLSKEYAARRRQAIDPQRAATEVAAGMVREAVGDTTALVAADAEGTVVCWITSLSASFGCAEVVEGTGILLNNRAGRGFELTPGHPNCIAPGKRTMHTLMAFLACRGGRPMLAWATPGGDGQPQWNTQVFSHIVDGGMGIQEAVEVPRWLSLPGTDPAGRPAPYELRLEAGFPPQTVDQLAQWGHAVREMGEMEAGGACQAVLVDGAVYRAGSDPRVDGCAIGF
ncbi:MAG: gamma-glutamyltransferase [Armatimonadota bacterium]|nr:gamma-glutamyltransferase [Armatimonadota bacterium]MDR7438008.1 gamma-glutamyltransferase [Armatimonadota bacterium]MDR7471832.1 gamma-glutamyltransferase [Armatimonadota bacterium]MDR7507821.1 gamma-glutamyltransferase [Armatimonadota bacterium]MDR7515774.1 gamma-glutamyltransferase [Armatimonadota bacterium]